MNIARQNKALIPAIISMNNNSAIIYVRIKITLDRIHEQDLASKVVLPSIITVRTEYTFDITHIWQNNHVFLFFFYSFRVWTFDKRSYEKSTLLRIKSISNFFFIKTGIRFVWTIKFIKNMKKKFIDRYQINYLLKTVLLEIEQEQFFEIKKNSRKNVLDRLRKKWKNWVTFQSQFWMLLHKGKI